MHGLAVYVKEGLPSERDLSLENSASSYLCMAGNRSKRALEAAKFAYANKTKESFTSQKLWSRDFWRIANSVLNIGKSAIPPLFNCPEVFSSTSDKAKLFSENASTTLILMT